MLDELGAAAPLIAQGLKAPRFQYRSRQHGLLAQFDFGRIADATRHPYRVQCEQSKLTRILLDWLRNAADSRSCWTQREVSVTTGGNTLARNGGVETRAGAGWIAADGARSDVRRSRGIEFVVTQLERFVGTPDFRNVIRARR
jgi:3-(3-hydroxy-phenyl)propionate hydroxylase